MQPLVSPQWLFEQRNNPNLVILDASIGFQIPGEPEKITHCTITNALRFDYDNDFCDSSSTLPHMMPSQAHFNSQAQKLGISTNSVVVVFDNSGTFASPRAWWMLKAMGHKECYILNGGLPAWIEAGFDTVAKLTTPCPSSTYAGVLQPSAFVSAENVLQHAQQDSANIIDARSLARFHSEVPEPREGLRSGHIPTSVCLPFSQVMHNGAIKSTTELKAIFAGLKLTSQQPIIFSCGSGVTACILLLAAHLCGYSQLSIYDGSWTEWGQRHELPISTSSRL